MKRVVWTTVGVLALGVAAITVVSVGIAIWPGSMKLTAPVLCPADQPDPFVVRTTTSDSEGTSTSFSLFCMGDRGDFTEVGSWEPYGLLFLYTWAAFVVLSALLVVRIRWRRRRRARAAEPDPDPASTLDTGPVSPIS
ncbi:MAG TPA: hypothetical protein VGO78_13115 [Acidimicrobiales bacterium]|nr:hypothetical protein [Acidimicrobiales bacterium]